MARNAPAEQTSCNAAKHYKKGDRADSRRKVFISFREALNKTLSGNTHKTKSGNVTDTIPKTTFGKHYQGTISTHYRLYVNIVFICCVCPARPCGAASASFRAAAHFREAALTAPFHEAACAGRRANLVKSGLC